MSRDNRERGLLSRKYDIVSIHIFSGKVPANELQIYTWVDATLKELTSLVREVNPESRRKGTLFDIARVYPVNNARGGVTGPNGQFLHYNLRDIGTTVSGRKGVDDGKTLKQCGFEIGDYLDIAITPPNAGGRGLDRMEHDRDNRRDRRGFGGRRDRNGDRRRPY